ncbi:MAG: ABC transporter substrate-binding protein [Candidatus Rokubacteria bacterium]|nr:ABC transporter substrate-binding protein [Candidatus Rokubacteria bacterium]
MTRVLAITAEQADGERAPRADVTDRRRTEMRRIAAELFDFEEMARRSLSIHWASRSKAEQAEFVEHFTELLERTYVARIESYAGEKIRYPNEIVDGSYATVRSRIMSRRGGETTLDYRLHQEDGKWKVFDISLDGVSFVSTYRSEFNRIIQSSSYASLVDRMKKKRLEIEAIGRRVEQRPEPTTIRR